MVGMLKNSATYTPTNAIYWPKTMAHDATYNTIIKNVYNRTDDDFPVLFIDKLSDVQNLFQKHPNITLYVPVFSNSRGWWSSLLPNDQKTTPQISEKMIITPDCQLFVIKNFKTDAKSPLMAGEVRPSSTFFNELPPATATVRDMIATDSGTVLTLFHGLNPRKLIKTLTDTGNRYHGILGSDL